MSTPTRSTGSQPPPPPISRTVARIIVPLAILGTAAALLAITGVRALERLPEVRVTPVALIPAQGRASNERSAADENGTVQAPGWIEPAPFATELRALRDGTIAEVRVLEGASVASGEVIAVLEHAAETIALAEAEAALAARRREAEASAELAELAAQSVEIPQTRANGCMPRRRRPPRHGCSPIGCLPRSPPRRRNLRKPGISSTRGAR